MRNSKNLSRIIALIISVSVLASALPSFGVLAAETDPTVGANYQGNVTVTGSAATKNEQLFTGSDNTSLVKTAAQLSYNTFENGKWTSHPQGREGQASYLADCDIENKYYYNSTKDRYTNANHYMCSARGFTVKAAEKDESGCDVAEYRVDGTKYSVDIIHDLQREEAVKKVIVSHHSTPHLRAGHYVLYASKTRDTLFDDANIVKKIEYNYTASTSHIFKLAKAITARYVAIRVYNPYATANQEELRANGATKVAGNAYIRMFEFNVFGEGTEKIESRHFPYKLRNDETAENPDSIPTFTFGTDVLSKNNLVAGLSPSSMFYMQGASKYNAYAKITGVSVSNTLITDGNAETGIEVTDQNYDTSKYRFVKNGTLLDDESKMFLQFNYRLDGTAKVSDISVYFHETADISAGHIKVSVAENEADLFNSAAAGSFISGDIYSSYGSSINVAFNAPQEGNYVGIRIICPVKKYYSDMNNCYARISEIAVFGNYSSTVGGVRYNYKIDGNNTTKTGNAEVSYSGNPDLNGKYSVGTRATIHTTSSVRDPEGTLHSFVRWEDGSGSLLGTDTTITITLDTVAVKNIYAIYGVSDKVVAFTFLDYWGNTIHTATVPFGQYISREDYEAANAKLGDVPGQKIKYSEFRFGSRKALMPTWNADVYNFAADTATTFTPIYEPDDKAYTVTVNGEPQASTFTFDQKITLNDSSADYWTVNGVEWCKGTEFTAYVTEDMAIESKKGSLSQKVALAKNPVVSGSSVGFAARFVDIPDGAMIKGMGLLLVSGDSTVTEITTANAQQLILATKRSGNEFMVTVRNLPKKVTRRARVYVNYDAGGGNYGTVYSNEITVTMP